MPSTRFSTLPENAVLLVERDIAARMHDDLSEVGLDIRKELDAIAELAIGHLHADEQRQGQQQRRAGMRERELHRAHIKAGVVDARSSWGTGAARPNSAPSVGVKNSATTSDADSVAISVIGMYFHELADDAGPEQQRRERGDARRGRRDHGAGHALARPSNRPPSAPCLPTCGVRQIRTR